MKKIDCRGLACPQPVVNTKKALEEVAPGATLIVVVDNPAARENVTLLAQNAGHRVEVKENNGEYVLSITRKSTDKDFIKQEERNPVPEAVDKDRLDEITYLVTSNLFGQGSADLGQVLMKSLFVALSEQAVLPRALVFLNTGVYLSTKGSPVIEQLQAMMGKGSTVLSCGTCLEYYKLKEKLAVGRISNMYEIVEHLAGAGKVITVA
ncbi:MAG TPA: sulfurtransferase-like selenium metabolism protein YedF [Desulfotomaculum sp.]|nr:sulfurtransferase-like selenium metabolism protein YedF [Desulfotomaculum sp.]